MLKRISFRPRQEGSDSRRFMPPAGGTFQSIGYAGRKNTDLADSNGNTENQTQGIAKMKNKHRLFSHFPTASLLSPGSYLKSKFTLIELLVNSACFTGDTTTKNDER